MTRIADIKYNDVVDCEKGFCVSFWVQGCPWHCKGCYNPQTWDFNGGKELPPDFLKIIDDAITANGIQRNFSVLGGEPLCLENKSLVNEVIAHVRNTFPNIKARLGSAIVYNLIVIAIPNKLNNNIFNI